VDPEGFSEELGEGPSPQQKLNFSFAMAFCCLKLGNMTKSEGTICISISALHVPRDLSPVPVIYADDVVDALLYS